MWQRLNPDTLGSESLNGFHFCFRLQLVDDYHFLHWVGPVFVEISNMCLWTTSKWEKNFGGHSQLIKEEVGVHVTGLFVLSLKSLNGRYWDTGCYKGAAFVSLCTPANQKEANLMTSKFSFTQSICSRSCTLSTLYSGTPEQYLMVTTVMRCHHWAFRLGLLSQLCSWKGQPSSHIKGKTFLNSSFSLY